MVPKNLREVKEKRLPGYELRTGYLLILKHGLAGMFPALITENLELFVCTDKEILKLVWEKIVKRSASVIELQLYANEVAGIGFNVSVGDDAEPINILSKERFDSITEKRGYVFMWSPGLMRLRDESEIISPFV